MTLQTASPANSALDPADALPAGTRLEDYEIDCVVARSAVALVYRAVDRRNEQRVAIKEFLPTGLAMRGDDGQVVARETVQEQNLRHGRQVFLEDAKSLAKCEHACLMPVLRVLECHGTVYKVMPYHPGPTLLEHRQKMAAAPPERLLRGWLEGLLGALALLHDQGRVHGAVSPGNILMLADDRPLLLDSDAVHAAILSERTRSMIAALEPCFAPQEQCEPAPARPLGPWTDLYALAATLRYGASGQLPGPFAQRPRGGRFEAAGPAWMKTLDTCLADAANDRPRSVAQLRALLGIERPTSPGAMASASAGLAPLLSSPLPRSPALAPGFAQSPLPLVVAGPAATAEVDAAAMPPPEDLAAADAAPPVAPAPSASAATQGKVRSRLRVAGVVASLLAVLLVVGVASRFKPEASTAQSSATTFKAAPTAAPSTKPPAAAAPVVVSTRPPAAAEDPAPDASKDVRADVQAARADVQPARAAAPNPPQRAAATPKEQRKSAATTTARRPVAAMPRARDTSPRQACAGRERYALLQCMEAQCSKKALTQHEQCVRLRRDRKL